MCLTLDKISDILHVDLSVFHIACSGIHRATEMRTHCLVSMVSLSVFVALLIATYVCRYQYKWKAFLRFHDKYS
jgi:hypothetical protein